MRVALSAVVLALAAPLVVLPQPAAPANGRSDAEISREVDRLLAAAWEREKITPSEPSTDSEFLRRLSIDLIGRVPRPEEVVDFLNDRSADKRRKKVEELLASPEYAKNWARIWVIRLIGRDSIRGRNKILRDPLEAWLEKAIASNMRYDAFVRELIAAEGSTANAEEGSVGYVLRWTFRQNADKAPNLAGHSIKTFMGIRIQCAQCHDHPYEKWTQQDFWGVAAFFARAQPKPIRNPDSKKNDFDAIELHEIRRGEVKIPNTTKDVPPKFLSDYAKNGLTTTAASRRAQVAEYVTAKDNLAFGRAFANWMWHQFFGVGFVNPVDDFSSQNKPSNPEALDLLARDFADNGFDMKRMVRVIVNTKAYQLSSRSSKDNARDRTYFSKAVVRPMTPEDLFRSLAVVTGLDEVLRERQKRAKGETVERMLDQALARFTFLFDNDEMTETLDFESTISQALFLMNGQLSTDMLKAGRLGAMPRILSTYKQPADRIEAIYLAVLSRRPTDADKKRFLEYVRAQGDRDDTYGDLFWVLLNTTEFFFNH